MEVQQNFQDFNAFSFYLPPAWGKRSPTAANCFTNCTSVFSIRNPRPPCEQGEAGGRNLQSAIYLCPHLSLLRRMEK
jgi:hypothetical protein